MNPYVKFVSLYAAYVLAIHLIPGPWQKWTSQGRIVDEWMLTHLAWGYLGGYFQLELMPLLILSGLNEGLEAYLRRIKFMGIWGDPESIANIAGDLSATSAGWYLARLIS